jgi:hypothetical protein
LQAIRIRRKLPTAAKRGESGCSAMSIPIETITIPRPLAIRWIELSLFVHVVPILRRGMIIEE